MQSVVKSGYIFKYMYTVRMCTSFCNRITHSPLLLRLQPGAHFCSSNFTAKKLIEILFCFLSCCKSEARPKRRTTLPSFASVQRRPGFWGKAFRWLLQFTLRKGHKFLMGGGRLKRTDGRGSRKDKVDRVLFHSLKASPHSPQLTLLLTTPTRSIAPCQVVLKTVTKTLAWHMPISLIPKHLPY